MSRLFFGLNLLLLLANCNNIDETTITDVEEAAIPVTDAWICEMQSFEEDWWNYEMYLEGNGDYIAISNTRILKVSKDGILNSIILTTYPDDDRNVVKIFNDKIYRFHYDNDFEPFDPTQLIKLQIYDFDFTLLSDHVLDSNGLFYDVEIESNNLFGMLVYNPDENTMTLKKLHLTDGLVAETVLSTSGTSPTNLHILENGDYFCTASSSNNNLTLLDNNLNLQWAKENNAYSIRDAKYIPGQGIYITGRGTFIGPIDDMGFVSLLDLNGNEINSVSWDAGERWISGMQINQEKICVVQTEPESNRSMLLSLLDYDLNIDSTIEIPGNAVKSNLIVNENGSFSFVYGMAFDPESPDFVPPYFTRIFKFDDTYLLPTNIIVQ